MAPRRGRPLAGAEYCVGACVPLQKYADKAAAKAMFRHEGLPTPDFAVLNAPDAEVPELVYPVIVKPKNEAVSFGITVCRDEAEMRAARPSGTRARPAATPRVDCCPGYRR